RASCATWRRSRRRARSAPTRTPERADGRSVLHRLQTIPTRQRQGAAYSDDGATLVASRQSTVSAKEITMKTGRTLLLTLPLLFALSACNKPPEPTLGSNNKDSLNHALDRRPNEQARDAVESTGDALKEAGGEIKDAVKDASK